MKLFLAMASPTDSSVAQSAVQPAGTRRWRSYWPFTNSSLPDWSARIRWFAAEILVVVVGVIIALAINAWWQSRQNAASEAQYLMLLSRDLDEMQAHLTELRAFEQAQIRDGVQAYRILSARTRTPEDQRQASVDMTNLTMRRTMTPSNATYTDLLSTGNLRLISNRALRDRIVSFYAETGRLIEIHNKNNEKIADDLFVPLIFGDGLFYNRGTSNIVEIAPIDQAYATDFASGYVAEKDYFWSLPEDSHEWARVKSTLLQRVRMSHIARWFADNALKRLRDMKDAVDAERTGVRNPASK